MDRLDFHVDSLSELTPDLFSAASVACMCAGFSEISIAGFATGDDFILYGRHISGEESEDGRFHRESIVQLRNYCGSLEMLVTDKAGLFLTYTKIDGGDPNEVIGRMYRLFEECKPYIDEKVEHSFTESEITGELVRKWRARIAGFDAQVEKWAEDRAKQGKKEGQA